MIAYTGWISSYPQDSTDSVSSVVYSNCEPMPEWDAIWMFRSELDMLNARCRELSVILTRHIRLLVGRPGQARVWFTRKLPAWSARRWRSVT